MRQGFQVDGREEDCPGANSEGEDIQRVQVHDGQPGIGRQYLEVGGSRDATGTSEEEARGERGASAVSSGPRLREAALVTCCGGQGGTYRPTCSGDRQRAHEAEGAARGEVDAVVRDEAEGFDFRQERPRQLGDGVRDDDQEEPSQADEVPPSGDDRQSRIPHPHPDDPRPDAELGEHEGAPDNGNGNGVASLRAEVRHLKDMLQVAEMRVSEMHAQRQIEIPEMKRLNHSTAHFRKRMNVAVESERKASNRESDAQRKLQLAERETRAVTFQNLSLQRQLAALMHNAVPRAQHESMMKTLESCVAEQADTIAALREQLAVRDDEACCGEGEEGEEEGGTWEGRGEEEGGDEDGGRDEDSGEMLMEGRKVKRRPVDLLRESVGVAANRQAPPRYFTGDESKPAARKMWEKRSTCHIAAVLRDRPVEHITTALRRLGCLRELADCGGFATECKRIVSGALGVISDRFSARLSVHIWDRLSLSRSKMDDLRHLLSSLYQPESDSYSRIRVWQNPTDPNDFLEMPYLVGRAGREKLFNQLADECEIMVGENGRCERDACACATQMYSRFRLAMRDNFSCDRPARPILYFDGTGGSLGKGITHAELGSADFDGDCKQSRATLSPLAMYTGNDHALPLRSNLSTSVSSFNLLSSTGKITLDDGSQIPCEPIVVGDMQGLKCIMGMTETCHSVWCKV